MQRINDIDTIVQMGFRYSLAMDATKRTDNLEEAIANVIDRSQTLYDPKPPTPSSQSIAPPLPPGTWQPPLPPRSRHGISPPL